MNALLPMLLAQSRSESLRESFRSHARVGRDEVLLAMLMAAAVLAGIWAVSRLLGLRRRRRGYNNPWQLFWALCKAHRLNWSDSWLLRRIAKHQDLNEPARLFLEAQHWDEQTLGAAFALEFIRLRALRKQLFGPAKTNMASEPAMPRPPVAAASPLFQRVAAPTLDIPPWNETQSVET